MVKVVVPLTRLGWSALPAMSWMPTLAVLFKTMV